MSLRGLLWARMAELPRGPLGWIGAWGMTKMHMFDRAMAPELDLQPDDELLDVGCGPGGLLLDHAAHVRFVAGLDVSEIQVAMARRRLAERIAVGTADIALGDAAALPWADGRFSVVSSINALKFVREPERALREIHRVLHDSRSILCGRGYRERTGATMQRFTHLPFVIVRFERCRPLGIAIEPRCVPYPRTSLVGV